MSRTRALGRRLALAVLVLAVVASACGGGGGGELTYDQAVDELADLLDDVDFRQDHVTRRANVEPTATTELVDTLPPIDQFPLAVDPDTSPGDVVIELFVSSEKAGADTDGWLIEVAEAFNAAGITTSSGAGAKVQIRKIASGIGYQFIASGRHLPHGYTPSNHLWIEMAEGSGVTMTPVSERLVPNVAGIVFKDETAEDLESTYGDLRPETLIQAVVDGDLVMGYTDPFASSTGLNFLLTVLDAFADGDQSRLLSPDVVSALEEFQRNVPFVALTTLQIRESVEAEGGSLDAFVMEWQTYVKTDSLQSGYRFVPFGIPHDNPLYGVGDLSEGEAEALDLLGEFASRPEWTALAGRYGFDPPAYSPSVTAPPGDVIIEAQQVWKEKKDGGRPVIAVFVADVSGSMAGSRILALREALLSGADFITADTSVGLLTFEGVVRELLPVAPFDLNQKARFVAAAEDIEDLPGGGTAMYDGILAGLDILLRAGESVPDAKLILLVLTDGETTEGLTFGAASGVIQGLGIPVYTVGFEADVDELARVSALVEAASLDAGLEDIEYKIGALFNAEL